MNISTLESLLRRYDPENDYAPISNADAALLEMVIDLAERVQELEAMLKPAPALTQPSMFPAGEDAPLFTLPAEPEAEPVIELVFSETLDPILVDVAKGCIPQACPPNTVGGCWVRLADLHAQELITSDDYDEIRASVDFIIAD